MTRHNEVPLHSLFRATIHFTSLKVISTKISKFSKEILKERALAVQMQVMWGFPTTNLTSLYMISFST